MLDAAIKAGADAFITGEMSYHEYFGHEEVSEQIKALKKLKEMANIYGCDISQPAKTKK